MPVKIYALIDPRDRAVRYVGKTIQPLAFRLQQHIWPARTGRVTEIRPQAGPQEAFLASDADIVIYGGGAGGGKTWGLLLEPLRHMGNPAFGAVIFRRTSPQITNEGGLWDKSLTLYPLVGAEPRVGSLSWIFPSGASLAFRHLQHESTVLDWQGSEIPLIGIDELTHLTEYQFFYLLSRNRSTCGVRPYVRATCNPDADSWVAGFIAWWIDQDTGLPIPARAGVVRWFVRINGALVWGDSPADIAALHPGIPPKSVDLHPGLALHDNPALLKADPGYLANLYALPLVEQERLLGGNWKIRPASGKVFNRAWFEIVASAPAEGTDCRYWDFAATEKELAKDDPDYTASILMRRVGTTYYILDCTAAQSGPAQVESAFLAASKADADAARAARARA
jgi:hypothetical protein